MRARFGLDGIKPKTLEEIGRLHRLTKERVRQIEAEALFKLRRPYMNYRVMDFTVDHIMLQAGIRVPSADEVAAASEAVAAAEAAAKLAEVNVARARMGLPRLEEGQLPPEEVVVPNQAGQLPAPAAMAPRVVGKNDLGRTSTVELDAGPGQWELTLAAEQRLIGTEADQRAAFDRSSGRSREPWRVEESKDTGPWESLRGSSPSSEFSRALEKLGADSTAVVGEDGGSVSRELSWNSSSWGDNSEKQWSLDLNMGSEQTMAVDFNEQWARELASV